MWPNAQNLRLSLDLFGFLLSAKMQQRIILLLKKNEASIYSGSQQSLSLRSIHYSLFTSSLSLTVIYVRLGRDVLGDMSQEYWENC